MKKIFRLGVIFSMLSLCFFLPKLNADSKLTFPDTEPEISMDFQDANLKDILKVFSIQSGLNFIASEALQDRKITLYLDKVPLEKAMAKLFKANNLSYELDREANIFIVKDWGKLTVETITKVFSLKHATVSSSSLKEEMAYQISPSAAGAGAAGAGGAGAGGVGAGGAGAGGAGAGGGEGKWEIEKDTGITKAVKKLLSGAGSVIEDFRTNSLIVTDTPSRMAVIAQVIASLDVPVPQVMLEVEMLDVSKNTVDKLGIKFGQTPFTMVFKGPKKETGFPFYTTPLAGINKLATAGSIDLTTSYTVLLDFLRTRTDTKYLARPRILTLNNETAEIKITTQETVGVTTATTGGEGIATQITNVAERVETGVALRVTPQINLDTGEIIMFIVPTVKDTSTSTFISSGTTYFKDPEERSTKSTVKVKDGETVIIAGLIRNDSSETITKLPILGDIPILGTLFRHKNKEKDKERELLVFITPHIIKDATDVKLAQSKKVTLPEREQNAVSGVNRELTINAGLESFEKKKR